MQLANTKLTAGEHNLTLAYREDGALIDKIGITTYVYGPEDRGAEAVNIRDKYSMVGLMKKKPIFRIVEENPNARFSDWRAV